MLKEIETSGKQIHLYGVDDFKTLMGWPKEEIDIEQQFLENTYAYRNNFVMIPLDSAEAARYFDYKSLDFVFLDTGHNEAAIRRDIEAWLPKVKSGGVIAGHDYTEEWADVIKVVGEYFGEQVDKSYIDEQCWLVKIK